MERYGSQKTAEMARNNFPHIRQEKGEAREYRRGWAHERSQTVRDDIVLNVFMLGSSDENLVTSLQMEYSKPSVGYPPSVKELSAYVRRLESSRSLRTMKRGDVTHSRGPSYTMRNNYGKGNYPSRGQAPPDHAMRNQQQSNLQGYINAPTVQQWNRHGAGNAVDRDAAYAQKLCHRCGSNAHMARDCDAWN